MKGMSRTMFRERVILVAHNIGGSAVGISVKRVLGFMSYSFST